MYKKFSLFLCFTLCACGSWRDFAVKKQYSKLDPVIYQGEQYLIPIPANYCKYDAKSTEDIAWLEQYEDAANFEEEMGEQLAIYVDCAIKHDVHIGQIRYAPRVISVMAFSKMKVKYIPRNVVIKVMDKANDTVKENHHVQYLKNYSEFILKEENLAKYDFPQKRKEIIKQDANYILHHDIHFNKIDFSYDENAAYVQTQFNNDDTNFYQRSIFTKMKDNVLMISFEDNVSKQYNASTLLKLRNEAKSYAKYVIAKNDDAIRQYNMGSKQVKLTTLRGYEFISSNNLNEALLENYTKKGIILAEAAFKIDEFNNFLRISLNFSDSEFPDGKILNSRDDFLDVMQNRIKELADQSGFEVMRQENGILVLSQAHKNVNSLSYLTLVNHYPLEIAVEIYSNDKAIEDEVVQKVQQDLIRYVGILDHIN